MTSPTTSWDLIQQAAAGDRAARDAFLESYGPVVRATLAARWRGGALAQEVDDALQDVWVECFKTEGALERAPERAGRGFRAFLHGVALNVARRREERSARGRPDEPLSGLSLESPDTTFASQFDREWARRLVRDARDAFIERARAAGEDALRRVELLRLRFFEDVPIREVAERWQVDAAKLHHQYARAREEFRDALRATIQRHDPGKAAHVERELERLLADLS